MPQEKHNWIPLHAIAAKRCTNCGLQVADEMFQYVDVQALACDGPMPMVPQKPKSQERPCLKCKAMRAFTYDLKKDWFQCTICLYCYSPETMKQVKDNFTYPGTAAFLKSFFPFPVDSSYPSQYQQQKYEQAKDKIPPPGYKLCPCGCDTFELIDPPKPVPGYRERASIEFEGVEELDPSLWTSDGDTGLL